MKLRKGGKIVTILPPLSWTRGHDDRSGTALYAGEPGHSRAARPAPGTGREPARARRDPPVSRAHRRGAHTLAAGAGDFRAAAHSRRRRPGPCTTRRLGPHLGRVSQVHALLRGGQVRDLLRCRRRRYNSGIGLLLRLAARAPDRRSRRAGIIRHGLALPVDLEHAALPDETETCLLGDDSAVLVVVPECRGGPG